MTAKNKKILIIRFSSIGDIVLTTPIIRTLKKQSAAEIHYLTKEKFASILQANPYVDKIFVLKNKLSEVMPELKAENYDIIIDLHRNIRSFIVKFGLATKSFSFDKINLRKWLIVNFKIDILPRIHIVNRYFDAVQSLGINNDGKGLDYFIPPNDEVDIKKTFGVESSDFIVFVVGAAHNTKKIPLEKSISIIKRTKIPVFLIGGPAERETGEKIIASTSGKVINTCGNLTISQSASLINQSSQVITPDTGMMHIAAAFRKNIIAIWGNTIPEFGMYPYLPDGINTYKTIEVKNLKCRPCSKIGFEKCPKKHFRCMESIDIEDIVVHLERNS